MSTMNIVQRVRERSVCPPSLLSVDRVVNVDGFEQAVASILDNNTLSLAASGNVAGNLNKVIKMAQQIDNLPASMIGKTKEVLEQRRCIILAIVGATPSTSTSLARILSNGYLTTVKGWLDEILNGSIGGVDLLLHLLTNIINLPVTKSIVKNSGMGKAIGSIEKHSICTKTKNKDAIINRVQQIKDAWNKSVKVKKEKSVEAKASKRPLQTPSGPATAAKRSKLDEDKDKHSKSSSSVSLVPPASSSSSSSSTFSSLIKKVSNSSPGKGKENSGSSVRSNNVASKDSSRTATERRSQATASSNNPKSRADSTAKGLAPTQSKKAVPHPPTTKKSSKRVKWADHFGGALTLSCLLEGEDAAPDGELGEEGSVSWTDRKLRDRLREKELIANAKKNKLMDVDDDNAEMLAKALKPSIAWTQPRMLPDRPDIPKPQLDSKEIAIETDRISKVSKVHYLSDNDVPAAPAPISDVEQALNMPPSAPVADIPFFVPQIEQPPAVASYAQPQDGTSGLGSSFPPISSEQQGATAQFVQALGLPLFLVGQNSQALQTLASSPGLLSTLVEPNGMYNEARLMGVVQTLTQNLAQNQPQAPVGGFPQQQAAFQPSSVGIYGPASSSMTPASAFPGLLGAAAGAVGTAAARAGSNGYRGDQNNSECNLHLSGYGPTTTQSDIIQLFAPYVIVDEVVMKGTFSFVNTTDSVGAKRAREALNGALLGGTPVRINVAQRRARDPPAAGSVGSSSTSNSSPSNNRIGNSSSPTANHSSTSIRSIEPISKAATPFVTTAQSLGLTTGLGAGGEILDVNNVRDDRGNVATKNLFVAGYGPGTTEQQLRDIFGLHATIVGVIMKGTFSFVNTADRVQAIQSREALSSTVLNGGILRINFAKETGRLGTSFDLTYGTALPPVAAIGNSIPSHYGHPSGVVGGNSPYF